MNRIFVHLLAIALFVSTLILAGPFPAQSSDGIKAAEQKSAPGHSYRSPSRHHKVLVYDNEPALREAILASGGTVLAEYQAFSLLQAPLEAAESLTAQEGSAETRRRTAEIRDDMNLLLLRTGVIDTTSSQGQALRVAPDVITPIEVGNKGLYLVQMIGPVKDEWIDLLRNSVDIVSYVPNNAYLVRADQAELAELTVPSSRTQGFIQWTGEFRAEYKIAPELPLESEAHLTATVQFVTGRGDEARAEQIRKLSAMPSVTVTEEVAGVEGFTNLRVSAAASEFPRIARLADVVWIEPYLRPRLMDERQSLIVAGLHSGNQLGNPGYLAWLRSKGLASTPDFIVDVADTGIDKGSLDPEVLHKDFLNPAGLSRVLYAKLHSSGELEGTNQDTSGHGTLDASIVGGYNVSTASSALDASGYNHGVGVHPFVKLGISKIFYPDYTNPNLERLINTMYRDGARISSNSWGTYSNTYTIDCQSYDSFVRDARRDEPGNQEMTIVFASGNEGKTGKLASPATAKNLITVGATENMRTGMDGCGIDSTGADDPLSVIDFSSGGLTVDGRTKPEIVAPGTHIQGAASQDRGFIGDGVCGPKFYPANQLFYTWSSGTSHAAPAVSGGAALVRQYFQQSTGQAPSPAMIKAYLTNSTTYLTGNFAGDDLPGSRQGFGLMNLGRAFDNARRMLIDQSQLLAETGQTFSFRGRISDPTKPIRITLVWTDAPGNPSSSPVVNNLDLQVRHDGNTYSGNNFSGSSSVAGGTADPLNNTEAIWLAAGTTGEFEVRIVAANLTGDGVPGNGDGTDQDFALVVYNAHSPDAEGGPTPPTDAPPTVTLRYPNGGESVTVGNVLRVLWDASDDKGIQSQRVEFSSDNGATYDVIATLDGKVRFFDWRVPSLPTTQARIRVSALDGVNLPAATTSLANFSILSGPTDTTPPQLTILSPTGDMTLGGGTKTIVKWREADNIGVIKRVLEYSGDGGENFQEMVTVMAPSSGEVQTYEWEIPVGLTTERGRIRISIFDGADNSAAAVSQGKFTIWGLPIITEAKFIAAEGEGGQNKLEVYGRQFRLDDTTLFVDGIKLKKLKFEDKCSSDDGRCKKVISVDKKLLKRLPEGTFVDLEIRLGATGQVSPKFQFKRKRPKPDAAPAQ